MDNKIIVTDTSVLINFLNIDRTDLLKNYPGQFLITEHVISEITDFYPQQKERLDFLLKNGILCLLTVNETEELRLFNELNASKRFGIGECSAIACAICRKYILAIDDKRARKQAIKISSDLKIITTQELIIDLIRGGIITASEANEIRNELHNNYRFTISSSFLEVV